MPKYIDLLGKRFNSLVVIERVGSARGNIWWDCLCDCGRKAFRTTAQLNNGLVASCGCAQRMAAAKTCLARGVHFMRGTRIYRIWRGMRQRCLDKNYSNYPYYGGRGITICSEWMVFTEFYNWAITSGYSKELSIDRINVNGNYEPKNCRWATPIEQSNNKASSRKISFGGESLTVAQWARRMNINQTTLNNRILSGWPIEKALSMPADYKNRVM